MSIALAHEAQLVGHCPTRRGVTGSIPRAHAQVVGLGHTGGVQEAAN